MAVPNRHYGPMGTEHQCRGILPALRRARHPQPSPARRGAAGDPGGGEEATQAEEGPRAGGESCLPGQPEHVPGQASRDAQTPEKEGGPEAMSAPQVAHFTVVATME